MKKRISFVLIIGILVVCTGCYQTETDDLEMTNLNQDTTEYDTVKTGGGSAPEVSESTQKTPVESSDNSTIETETVTTDITNEPMDPGEPPRSIEVRSWQELLEMKEMIACEDDERVQQYLSGIDGGLVQSKDDLIAFVSLVEKNPHVDIIDGEITWISYMIGTSVDTNEPYEILYISTISDNGDWVRLEYLLSVKDVEGKIAKEASEKGTVSLITEPLCSKDGKITFHMETREKHPTDPGDVINWVANVEGIFTRVVYYTANASKVVTSNRLSEVEVSHVPTSETIQ